ncbi:hypothetical protein [Mycolicibacterium vanbaalenii]|uniref:hypothetical protein n=1 Tax=Mycolicibacterium vanbaalenii TaxID=110539 RepID=UPI00059D09B7|nr:hypothetical protein [Mycolicibacterium vanbaalenii]MCV7127009.1 hypothetical protein [Mycolicibacterium vanbaalenii PYR-1]
MIDPETLGVETAKEFGRALDGLYPDATNVRILRVNAYPDRFELLDYRADLPDGSTVHKARIILPR